MPELDEEQKPAEPFLPVQQDPNFNSTPPPAEKEKIESLSIEQIAREVIAGHWGRGLNRRKRLEAAGYNPDAVNAEVEKIFKR